MSLSKIRNRDRMRVVRTYTKEEELAYLAYIEKKRTKWTRYDYAEYLQKYYWDYFLTVTFRKERKEPYYALKQVWYELDKYNVQIAFLACEPFQSGDLHIHGIVAGAAPGWKPDISLPWDIWAGLFEQFGRSKVEACNSAGAVTSYCAKYILKQQTRAVDYYAVYGDKFHWDGRLINSN